MLARELLERAHALCRRRGIRFPSDLLQYAYQWQRESFDLEFCWCLVKPLLSSGRPLWPAEVEIRRHHARLQSKKDGRNLRAGRPLGTTPQLGQEPWWDTPSPEVVVLSPASVSGIPDNPDCRPLCAEQQRAHPRARRQPYRKRTGTKAHKVRELIKGHVVRRGYIEVRKLERIAKNEGLLEEDQELSRCSTFRRVMKELNIESHRVGYGPGASYVWRVKPPAWTRGLELGVHG
jgi:hypothetical protein